MKVSVIIPVFNVEKYLEGCLNSILGQSYTDFEVIVVDDGSTDNSGEICDRFARKDRRIRVVHKNNEGVVGARQSGLKIADGDYIAFVDADDWIGSEFLACRIRVMEQEAADMIITGCTIEYAGKSEAATNRIASGIYEKRNMIHHVYPRMLCYGGFYEFGIMPYLWNKLYKKQLLISCHSDVDPDIYDGEDAAIVYPYLLKAGKIVITDAADYHYRIHSESATAQKKTDYYQNVSKLYLYLTKQFQQSDYCQLMMPQLDHYMRMMIWQGNPVSFIESLGVIFPFQEVPKGARIILYGAGYAGRAFHHQICLSGYCDIAAWVDQAYEQTELNKMGVVGLEALQTETYDYVVLAVRTSDLAENITTRLLSCGVDEGKIIFCAQ